MHCCQKYHRLPYDFTLNYLRSNLLDLFQFRHYCFLFILIRQLINLWLPVWYFHFLLVLLNQFRA